MARKRQMSYADIIRESQESGRVNPVRIPKREPKPKSTTPIMGRGHRQRNTPFNLTPMGQMTMGQRKSSASLAKTRRYIKGFVGDVDAAMRQMERDVTSSMTPLERKAKQRVMSAAGRGVRGRKAWSSPRVSPSVPVTPVSAGGQFVSPRGKGGPIPPPKRAGNQMVRGAGYRPGGVKAARASTPNFMLAGEKPKPPKVKMPFNMMRRDVAQRVAASSIPTPENVAKRAQTARAVAGYRGNIATGPWNHYHMATGLAETPASKAKRAFDAGNAAKQKFASIVSSQTDVANRRVNAAAGPVSKPPNQTPRLRIVRENPFNKFLYTQPKARKVRITVPTNKYGMTTYKFRHNQRVRELGYAPFSESIHHVVPKKEPTPVPVGEARRGPVPGPQGSRTDVDTSKTPDQTPEKSERYSTKKSKPGGIKFDLPKPPVKIVPPAVAVTYSAGPTKTTTKSGREKVKRKRGPKPNAVLHHKSSGLTAVVTGRKVDLYETDRTTPSKPKVGKPFSPMLQLPYEPGKRQPLTAEGIGKILSKMSKPEVTEPSKKKVAAEQAKHESTHGKKISAKAASDAIIARNATKTAGFESWLAGSGKTEAEKTASRMRKSPLKANQAVISSSKEAGLLREGKMPKPSKEAIARAARKGARVLGPVGGIGLLAAGLADPAEAVGMTVDKVGGDMPESLIRKKMGNKAYNKMKREEAAYYRRKKEKQRKLRKTYFGID